MDVRFFRLKRKIINSQIQISIAGTTEQKLHEMASVIKCEISGGRKADHTAALTIAPTEFVVLIPEELSLATFCIGRQYVDRRLGV